MLRNMLRALEVDDPALAAETFPRVNDRGSLQARPASPAEIRRRFPCCDIRMASYGTIVERMTYDHDDTAFCARQNWAAGFCL